MTPEQTFTMTALVLTLVNVLLTYSNFRHNRKKDFQDRLFSLKIEAYNVLNEACYFRLKDLDINSTPFVQIYDYKDDKTWQKYCEKSMGPEIVAGFKLRNLIYAQAIYLPSDVLNRFLEFADDCISFVSQAYNFDTEHIINRQDALERAYVTLVNEIRMDLKIEVIDSGLQRRLSSKI